MIVIDGSQGEGGGQILRSALALSLVTGTPFRIENIRARRKSPGLARQHLTAVRAATELGEADVEGDALRSTLLEFRPRRRRPGPGLLHFDVGTAGSCTLVLQTILPALLMAEGPVEVVLEGGTHNPFAPPFEFIDRAFLPLLRRMGAPVEVFLDRHGFFPAGGGRIRVLTQPASALEPLVLLDRGDIQHVETRALLARLPSHIGERETRTVIAQLRWPERAGSIQEIVDSRGPGNALLSLVTCEHITEVFTAFGQKGVPAEKVATEVASETKAWLDSAAPVGTRLADQLLIPMALAGGGRFRTMPPTAHTTTNAAVVERFLDVKVMTEQVSSTPDVFEINIAV